MNRRAFLGTLGLGALAVEARGAAKVPRVGYLSASSLSIEENRRKAFRDGLRDLGWIEAQNILVQERWAEARYDRLPGLAAELVTSNPDVIVAAGTNPVIRAAKEATSTIPVVMAIGVSPVEEGFIASIRRPGGNITGMAWDPDEAIGEKYIEFLHEMVPALRRVGMLIDRAQPSPLYRKAQERAGVKLGLTLHTVEAGTPSEIEKAFAIFTKEGAQAVFVYGSQAFGVQRHQIVALAVKHKLPDIYAARENVEAGGLMTYGVNIAELFRGAARCVDRILRGTKPSDLPVEQPTKYELVINGKRAKALGLPIPPLLLLRADEVIQ